MVMRRRSRVLRLPVGVVPRSFPRRMAATFLKLRRLAGKPVEVFDASRVERMLRSGQPDNVQRYLERFLMPIPVSESSPVSIQLLMYVGVFKTLAKVAAGGEEGAKVASLFLNPTALDLKTPATICFHNPTRAAMLWQKLEQDGLNAIMGLVSRCPELQGDVRLPRKRPLLWDVSPHGLQECPSRCRQAANRTPADVLIRAFLRERLLSVQGKGRLARSRNTFSQSAVSHMKVCNS